MFVSSTEARNKQKRKIKVKELKILGRQNAGIKIHKGVSKSKIESKYERRHKTVGVRFASVAILAHDSY